MSDELDELLDDVDEDAGRGNPGNNKRLSDALHRKERETAALEKKLAQLQAEMDKVADERRAAALAAAGKELGIKEKHMAFYPKDAEADLDALRQWAIDSEFISGDGERSSDDKSQGFDPGGFGTPDGDTGRTGQYTVEEVIKMYNEGERDKAAQLVQAGKVRGIGRNGAVDYDHPDYEIDYGGAYRYE